MIIGVGCDIVHIERIKQVMDRHSTRFLKRIYHEFELAQMPQSPAIYSYLAKRFAAKEAFAKAIGTGIGATLSFKDIYVSNQSGGRPSLQCTKALPKLAEARIHLSLADDHPFAVAYVVIERLQHKN